MSENIKTRHTASQPRRISVSSEIEIQIFQDCRQYLLACAEFMAQDPYTTNVIGVVATGIASGSRPQGTEDIFIAICRQNIAVGMAMHTPPHSLFLSRMPLYIASDLAKSLSEIKHDIPGVNGELSSVSAFAQTWGALTSSTPKIQTATRMYHLKTLQPPAGIPGMVRIANHKDLDLVRQWLVDFNEEATHNSPAKIAETAERRINNGEVYLWVWDSKPVSLACRTDAVCGVGRIGPVYTPTEYRSRGFGSAVVAAATQSSLELGTTHVALYTDLSNPTSNSIYQKIGFTPDHDGQECFFE